MPQYMLWVCDCCAKSAKSSITVDPPHDFHLTELIETGRVSGISKKFIWCDDCFAVVVGEFGGIPPRAKEAQDV